MRDQAPQPPWELAALRKTEVEFQAQAETENQALTGQQCEGHRQLLAHRTSVRVEAGQAAWLATKVELRAAAQRMTQRMTQQMI